MSSFPHFSNIASYAASELQSRRDNLSYVSKLNAWVRIASAVDGGCQIVSNPDFSIFGESNSSIYGNGAMSGTIGVSWNGKTPILAEGEFMGFRPKPNVTSIEVDEGAGNLSRKASFTITCYTKAQLDVVCKYFLEPGYTVFLEWGWNTANGTSQYTSTLDPSTVADFQDFVKVNEKRKNSSGHYDNYLGFITGGSIGINGATWEVNVKLTGFTELPAYLMTTDRADDEKVENKDSARLYQPSEIDSQTDLGKQRFMMMFNRLPSNRLTKSVAALIDNVDVANPINFLNFDEKVKANINDTTDGTSVFGFQITSGTAETKEGSIDMPDGTKIIGDEAFIRFGTLMKIFNTIIDGDFKLANNKTISLKVSSERTICNAFPRIFSTDKSKLFIPNAETPQFSLFQAANSTTEQDSFNGTPIDNSVKYGDKVIMFPNKNAIVAGAADKNGTSVKIQPVEEGTFEAVDKKVGYWGWLDDLYVNMDFIKGIIETKNFSVKDGLYQILNGMSAAAGGIWDFNIIESSAGNELIIVDLNISSNTNTTPVSLDLMGVESVFIDASLDLDISGAKMNQIIGSRLGKKLNGSQPDIKGQKTGLFSNSTDMILTALELRKAENSTSDAQGGGQAGTTEEGKEKADKEAKEKNLQIFLDKIAYIPKVEITEDSSVDLKLEDITYVGAFNDQVVFQGLKDVGDTFKKSTNPNSVSPLMPIKFTGTVHGVSGIKRGDKFIVNGLPKDYEGTGFFQVTAVKHIIDGMLWKTEIEGGFRKKLN